MAKPKAPTPPAADAAPPAPDGAEHKESKMSDLNNSTALGTVTITIADLPVTLPVRFAAGHTLSADEAKILDAAFQRQFTNNQTANQKNREKGGKALLTAEDMAKAYEGYVPTVGDGVRQSAMEKMQTEAGWNAYVALVTEYNADPAANAHLIPKAQGKLVALPTKPMRGQDGKVTMTLQERRDSISATMRGKPEYADRVQAELDKLTAQRSTKAAEATVEMAEGDVL